MLTVLLATLVVASLTPAQRSLRGRIGAAEALARHGGHALTAHAREVGPASAAYWERQVDPEGVLAPADRAARAAAAKRAHFLRLAFMSARARSRTSNGAS